MKYITTNISHHKLHFWKLLFFHDNLGFFEEQVWVYVQRNYAIPPAAAPQGWCS